MKNMTLPHANLTHIAFPQPRDPSVLVWRYLDLAKYVSLLTGKSLYLPATDRLGDPFEGSLPRNTRQAWDDGVTAAIAATGVDPHPDLLRNMEAHRRDNSDLSAQLRRAFYASCWRMGNYESEAMWKLYCGEDQGVAVVLPYSRLADSLTDATYYIGRVSYLDYDNAVMQHGNTFYPYMHKRIAFEHESEVRILRAGDWASVIMNRSVVLPVGVELPWDPAEHVERIVVSPYAMRWFHDVVRNITRSLSPPLVPKICESAMAGEPSF
jgi:hypothetical protein